MWGRCRGCDAKDEEIRHLLALLNEANAAKEKAHARVAEVLAPGIDARLAPRESRPRMVTLPRLPQAQTMPGYGPEVPPPAIEVDGA